MHFQQTDSKALPHPQQLPVWNHFVRRFDDRPNLRRLILECTVSMNHDHIHVPYPTPTPP